MDATDMFLHRHARIHAHVERLTAGLSQAEIRDRAHPDVNPLAWLLWHVARAEDAGVNLLVVDGVQVLDSDWSRRLRVERADVGSGMTMPEVLELSRQIDLDALADYWRAVGDQTTAVVASIEPDALDAVVTPERVQAVVLRTSVGPGGTLLQRLWAGTTAGDFLLWLPLTHAAEHVGQADLVRGMLGHPGRY